MSKLVALAFDFFLDQMVLSLVGKDEVSLLCAGTTNIRSKHKVVVGVSIECGLVDSSGGQKFDVTSSAIDVLFVLHTVLDNEVLSLVAEFGVLGRDLVESGILSGS